MKIVDGYQVLESIVVGMDPALDALAGVLLELVFDGNCTCETLDSPRLLQRGSSVNEIEIISAVIALIREPEGAALNLDTMAEIARLSPYYFARVSRRTTGIPAESSPLHCGWRGRSGCSPRT